MIRWSESCQIYLHCDPVDFRKAINGLAVIVAEQMSLSPYDPALFVFCNKNRSQLKVLYWDDTGFALWQKRLEKDKFKWPKRKTLPKVVVSHEQWCWLLRGFNISDLKPHSRLFFTDVA